MFMCKDAATLSNEYSCNTCEDIHVLACHAKCIKFNLFSSTLDYIKDTQWLNCLPVTSHLLLIPLEYHSHAIMRKDKKCRPMANGNMPVLNNKAKQITIMHPQLS